MCPFETLGFGWVWFQVWRWTAAVQRITVLQKKKPALNRPWCVFPATVTATASSFTVRVYSDNPNAMSSNPDFGYICVSRIICFTKWCTIRQFHLDKIAYDWIIHCWLLNWLLNELIFHRSVLLYLSFHLFHHKHLISYVRKMAIFLLHLWYYYCT